MNNNYISAQAKFLRRIVLFMLIVWSIAAILNSKYDSADGEGFGTIGYLFFSTIAIFFVSLLVIVFDFSKLLSSKLNRIILFWLAFVIFIIFLNSDSFSFFIRQVQNMSYGWYLYLLFFILSYNDKTGFTEQFLSNGLIFILIVQILLFCYVRMTALDNMLSDFVFISSNTIFYVLLLMPAISLVKKTWFRNSLYIVTYCVCIISFKRSALIFSTIALMCVFYFQNNHKSKIKKVISMIIASVVLGMMLMYFNDQFGSHIFSRMENIENDGGSGRTTIWGNVINAYNNKDILLQLFGSGADAVRIDMVAKNDVFGGYFSAHNDFLEILYDYGIIGLLIYLEILYLLIKRMFYHKRIGSPYFLPILIVILILLTMNMVSIIVISPTYIIYLTTILGMSEAYMQKHKFLINN